MTTAIEMMGHPEQPKGKEGPRARVDSLTEMPTEVITLSPAFLEALRKVAPKPRPRRLPYILTFATVLSIGISSGRRIVLSHDAVLAPPVASAATPRKTIDSTVTAPSALGPDVAVTSASGSATAHRPAGPPTTISVDDLLRTIPKGTKNRHPQAPR
jgi:hypothetical protein